MTNEERAALDAALAHTDPDRRLAALARLEHSWNWSLDADVDFRAWAEADRALRAELEKPARVRELVREVTRYEVAGLGCPRHTTLDRAFAWRLARDLRSRGYKGVRVRRLTRRTWLIRRAKP